MSQSPLQIKIISILIIHIAIIIRTSEFWTEKVPKNSAVPRKLIKATLIAEVKILI
jgi:hypothetical protein